MTTGVLLRSFNLKLTSGSIRVIVYLYQLWSLSMTMHLVGPYLTTTKYSSKKKTSKSKKLEVAKENHEAWLKKMGVGKSTLPTNKKGERVGLYDIPDYRTGPRVTSDQVAGHGAAREEKRYTGTLIKGIATMHKSNAVPIMNKQEAIDVSNMRRG